MVANQLYELCEAVGPEPTRYCFFRVVNMMHIFLSYNLFIYYANILYCDLCLISFRAVVVMLLEPYMLMV